MKKWKRLSGENNEGNIWEMQINYAVRVFV